MLMMAYPETVDGMEWSVVYFKVVSYTITLFPLEILWYNYNSLIRHVENGPVSKGVANESESSLFKTHRWTLSCF